MLFASLHRTILALEKHEATTHISTSTYHTAFKLGLLHTCKNMDTATSEHMREKIGKP